MNPPDDRILTIISIAFLFVLATWTVQPRLTLHDETLTIIKTRFGELDINRWPSGRTVIWWQDADYTTGLWRICFCGRQCPKNPLPGAASGRNRPKRQALGDTNSAQTRHNRFSPDSSTRSTCGWCRCPRGEGRGGTEWHNHIRA